MTRDELIKLAKQAGFLADSFGIGIWDSNDFNIFARLVEEQEREACASIVDNWIGQENLAHEIRARSDK